MKILVVNTGSTSTKMGLYDGDVPVFEKILRHTVSDLAPFKGVVDQYSFRTNILLDELKNSHVSVRDLACVVGIGGLLAPLEGGTYLVNEAMLADLEKAKYGEHASNLGGIIAHTIAKEAGIPAYIVDPVVVDEMEDIFRISGHPLLPRRSIFHALNQKAIARRYCSENGKNYNEVNLVVVHMGGGISVSLHSKGRVIDTNNALDGDGPFTPERSGSLPAGQLAQLCFSGEYTHEEVKELIKGKGGVVAYFGTNSMMDLEEAVAKGDPQAAMLMDAMALQVAKYIAAMAVGACGDINAILLTGGIARAKPLTDEITRRVGFVAPVCVYGGEDEISALALGALRVLKGEEEARVYEG